MFKRIISIILCAALVAALAACGSTSQEVTTSAESEEQVTEAASETTETETETEAEETTEAAEETTVEEETEAVLTLGTVPNTLAEDEDALVSTYAGLFDQLTYEDEESGLSITYNLYLPEGYDENETYPMVVFIADSSCTGSSAERSLTQGRGALVWASEEWQSEYPTIVAVPTYPVTILDDHSGYTTTEYVELTRRFIDYMTEKYAVDTDRIYGTGQSMGCMTSLILASEYPDLYAACMFVDGQWDVTTLSGLEDQTFIYFAAEDDQNAWNGAQEVIAMFDADGEDYIYEQWDGNWSVDELSEAAEQMFTSDEEQYFVSWLTGTITAGAGGGMGGASYHMASFDYAYNCVAVMEWLFSHSK